MSKSSIKAFGMFVLGLALVSVTLVARAQPAGDAPKQGEPVPSMAFKPVISVEVMMENQGRFFKEVKDGILDKSWKPAAKSAWLLAELGNVNQYQNDNPDYKKFAKSMSDESKKLAEALEKNDEAASKEALKAVGQTCSACHDQFKKGH